MRVKFWGVRGSIPAPIGTDTITRKIQKALIGAQGIDLTDTRGIDRYIDSLPLEIKGTIGGNTACVEVNAEGQVIILDAGSGLRELGYELMKGDFGKGRGTAHIFISHTHWDHIQGFPFFIPAYVPGNKVYVYSPKKDIRDRFNIQQIDQDMFPMKIENMGADLVFVPIAPDGVAIEGVTVDCRTLHHPGGSYAYRVKTKDKTMTYATDGEYHDLSQDGLKPYLDFFNDTDMLIFDSMYTFAESVVKEGWGHSTSLVGVDMAVKTGVKHLVLFHHEPTYTDDKLIELLEKTIQYHELVRESGQLQITLAVEGEEIEL